jgi:hypothetical protein
MKAALPNTHYTHNPVHHVPMRLHTFSNDKRHTNIDPFLV